MEDLINCINTLTGIPTEKLKRFESHGDMNNWFSSLSAIGATGVQKKKVEALMGFLRFHSKLHPNNVCDESLMNVAAAKRFCGSLVRWKAEEEVYIIMLNASGLILGYEVVSFDASCNGAMLSVRKIVEEVLKYRRCSGAILTHNHPGGKTVPTESDILATKKIKETLNAMNISLHDHIIVSDHQEYSFKQNGVMPS